MEVQPGFEFHCEDCNLVYSTKEQLDGHLKQKHSEAVPRVLHSCIIHGCDYSTNRKWNIWTHLKRRHQYPDNTIDGLKKKEVDYKKRERLELQRGRNFDFTCDCGLAYGSKKRLNEHIKRKHPERADRVSTPQVCCPAPGCSFACLTRELLVEHARQEHATEHCKYEVEFTTLMDEENFRVWKQNLEKATDSSFSVNSASPANAQLKRVYMWCAKANKVRTSRFVPDTERKRFGNYSGRSKRVQSHCTAFITATFHPEGDVEVKYCRDHIGHNEQGSPEKTSETRVKRELRNEVVDSDEDSYIDVGGEEIIDHEEYVGDEEVVEERMYSDEEEEDQEEKKPAIRRFLTATDRMRPDLNPSYAMDEEYEEEEEPAPQPSTSMRYMPPLQTQERGPRLGYPRPVRPHLMNPGVKDEANMTMMLLRESHQRVMHAVRSKKEREQIGRFNHHLQAALNQLDPPLRRIRRSPVKGQVVNSVKMEHPEELYELDPDDVGGHVEVVEEETVYEDEPGTSYDMHEYYDV